MEYKVIAAFDVENLVRQVNAHIGAGWKPLGGIAISQGSMTDRYVQALVKG